jgi:hypothetical protein
LPRRGSHRSTADAFFTNGTIVQLSIEASPSATEILRNTLRNGPRESVSVTLREGATVYHNVAVRLKGGSGSFRRLDERPGFTLDFNLYQPDARFHGLKKLHLNNGAQDPTCLSEVIGGQLFREAGVPAARAAHALVEFNGRRLGLYVVMEAMDGEFLAHQFQDKSGNLYGQTPSGDVSDRLGRMEGDAPLTYDDLQGLAATVRDPDAKARLEKIPQKLEIEKFISYMAMEMILAHHDGYTLNRHNFRLYHDPATDRFTFIPHDLDQLMKRPPAGLMVQPRGLVAQAVLSTPEFRARYQARICELATNVFVVPRLTNRVDHAVAAVLPTIQAYDPAIAATFTNLAAEFKTRIINRGIALEGQIEAMKSASQLSVPPQPDRAPRRR